MTHTNQPDNNKPKYQSGDLVRMSNTKGIFAKESNTERWSRQIFKIKSVQMTHPIMYELVDLMDDDVRGKLYEEELQKVPIDEKFAYEIVKGKNGKPITKKVNRKTETLVHWLGYPDKFDSYIVIQK